MKVKKRRKSSRYRGSQTAHRGAKERTRGSGNRGGYGLAGTGKRADQKKTLVIKLYGGDYFGKEKTLRRGPAPKKLKSINLQDIEENISSFKQDNGVIDLSNYKILGKGEISSKLKIKAGAASASAIKKIEAVGGTLTLIKKESESSSSEKPQLGKLSKKE